MDSAAEIDTPSDAAKPFTSGVTWWLLSASTLRKSRASRVDPLAKASTVEFTVSTARAPTTAPLIRPIPTAVASALVTMTPVSGTSPMGAFWALLATIFRSPPADCTVLPSTEAWVIDVIVLLDRAIPAARAPPVPPANEPALTAAVASSLS